MLGQNLSLLLTRQSHWWALNKKVNGGGKPGIKYTYSNLYAYYMKYIYASFNRISLFRTLWSSIWVTMDYFNYLTTSTMQAEIEYTCKDA